MIELPWLHYLKLPIFYASWLYFPAAAFLVWAIAMRSRRTKILAAALFATLTILAYARFVEPRLLFVSAHEIDLKRCVSEAGAARIVVFSDMHIGLFRNALGVERLARRVAALEPDLVLIAGDFTYYLDPDRFTETYAPLASLPAPVLAVLGNHDVGLPGPDVSEPLTLALDAIGLETIDNETRRLDLPGGAVEIAGLSDSWQRRQDMSVVAAPAPAPRIVLTHNPATVLDLPDGAVVDLLVAGHTHGGQIRIPGLTCAILRETCWVTLYGFAEMKRADVFVTSGTGMVGLPMRFLVPPRIDVLNVRYRQCDENESV